jgi:alpha-beta hydrolase superfamily lysophospholipase
VTEVLTFKDADGVEITYRRWLPDGEPKAIVQIAHGASEHSERYDRFARFLTERGYAVYADDHRGHGLTAKVTGVGKSGLRGWDGMVDDLKELGDLARADVGEVPLILFGHSMGSFLSQLFIQRYGDTIDGVVLSGSSGGLAAVADTVAMLETMPPDEPAPIFGPLNASFEPARTPFDWLSRDDAEVDRYIADPMCGDDAPLTMGFVVDMMKGGLEAWTPENEQRVRSDLPVLFITGEADPVSEGGKTVRELEARYTANGLKDVTGLYYPEARHELLNETNRDDVQRDVVEWLDRVTAR